MSNKLNKKARAYLIATVISVALVSMGIALAYFQASIQGTGGADLEVTVSSNPNLSFESDGVGIALTVNEDNFYEDGYDLFGSTTSTATLTADGSVVSATYNVYFNITENELDYSTENTSEEAELILVITTTDAGATTYVQPEGYDLVEYTIKNEDGSTTIVKGIDITNVSGMLNVAVDHEITIAEGESHTQDWTATLYFVNLDLNQIENSGKSFSAQFILGELTLREAILINNGSETGSASSYLNAVSYIEGKGTPSTYGSAATTNEGMFATEDVYGTSYYFRGAVDDNWVYFAGFYWRIIRIDGEGNIRMIYSGTAQPTEDDAVTMLDVDGSTQINTSTFSGSILSKIVINGTSYSMWETIYGSQYVYEVGEIHGNTTSSIIKSVVDTWIEDNIKTTADYQYIESVSYCNDRTYYTSSGVLSTAIFANSHTEYYSASYNRLISFSPSLKCTNSLDELELEAALITADEVMFAGGTTASSNKSYYLYTNSNYWTLSPSFYVSEVACVIAVYSTGSLSVSGSVYNTYGIRPVISFSSENLDFTGTGTWDKPYEILTNTILSILN